jgi:hypothetical protein
MIRQLTLSALLLVAMEATAQERMPPPKAPPMDEIAAAIGLDVSQRASVQTILEQQHAAMIALHEAMRSKLDALNQQTHAKLAKVLSPEQLARFERWHRSHRPPPPPVGPCDRNDQGDRQGPPGNRDTSADRPPRMRGPHGGNGMDRRPPPDDGDRPPPPPGNEDPSSPPQDSRP